MHVWNHTCNTCFSVALVVLLFYFVPYGGIYEVGSQVCSFTLTVIQLEDIYTFCTIYTLLCTYSSMKYIECLFRQFMFSICSQYLLDGLTVVSDHMKISEARRIEMSKPRMEIHETSIVHEMINIGRIS